MNRSSLRALAAVSLLAVVAACGADPSSPTDPPATPSAPAPSEGPTPEATPSVTPTPSPTPQPTDTPVASPGASPAAGGGFTVAPNAEADRLFLDRDECENRTDGYRLEFPEDWWTNTEIGKWPPCVWFSPTYYTVGQLDAVPDEIAITIEWMSGDRGSFEDALRREEVTVGGQPGVRVEYRGAEGDGGTMPRDWNEYVYQVQLGPTAEEGPNVVARTDTDMGGDYELNKAILDRIMATMRFIGSVQ
jgi:hypothetical protein